MDVKSQGSLQALPAQVKAQQINILEEPLSYSDTILLPREFLHLQEIQYCLKIN